MPQEVDAISPDSADTRLRVLEQDVSAIKQQVREHESDIRAFAPMTASHAVLTEQMLGFQRTLDSVVRRLDDDQKDREARQADASKDSQAWRRTILLFGLTSFVSILIAAATILVTVLA